MANPQREYIEDGYIKLSRKIFNSKTFSSLNAIQKLITIYLILMANHKDNEWWDSYQKKFITIKRGSFITSIEHIRKKIKDRLVTTKKIRTCVKLLKKMQFLAIERASRYSHITIIKYDLYQSDESYRARQRARQGQDRGKIRAINNNGKNGKNGKNEDTKSKEFFDKNSIVYQLTIYLEGKIRENNKSIKKRNEIQLQSWCKDMDYLIRIDKAKPNEIKKIIDWVVEDKFWAKNILCPASLRKHYPRFYKEVIDRGRSLEEKIETDHRLDGVD